MGANDECKENWIIFELIANIFLGVLSFVLRDLQIWLHDIHYNVKHDRYNARIKIDILSLVYYNDTIYANHFSPVCAPNMIFTSYQLYLEISPLNRIPI